MQYTDDGYALTRDEYKITSLLGSGAFATVYRGVCEGPGLPVGAKNLKKLNRQRRNVAIKILDLDRYEGTPKILTVLFCIHKLTMQKEIILMSQLRHENLNRWECLRRERLIHRQLSHSFCRRKPNLDCIAPTWSRFVATNSDLADTRKSGSLHQILKTLFKDGIDDESLIATLLLDTVKGLQYLHKNGIIHR